MKSVPQLIFAVSIAGIIALSGCGIDAPQDGTQPEAAPTQTIETLDQGFDTTDALADYLSSDLDRVDAYLESETNPDYDADRDADRLYVDFASSGQTNPDMKATASVIQAAAAASFDFDVLMVTGDGPGGEWSYIYHPGTIGELTANGQIVVAEVWDAAEQDFDSVHR